MNTLTVNLHLMMASFYRPSGRRRKILIEEHAFPSDHQAVESYLRVLGMDAKECLIVVPASDQGFLFDTDVILETITKHRDELALVLLPGVQYYTGQVFDMEVITKHARELDVPIGWDLAHAAGNIDLQLSHWGPDFACWCTYKYLNGGPGSLGGCFLRSDHARNRDLQRLAGWWGHERPTRFQMESQFVPEPNAQGWHLSNPPVLSLAAMQPSLELFRDVGGMETLREKAVKLGRFFRQRLNEELGDRVRVVTPDQHERSGCQLSLEIQTAGRNGRSVFDRLSQFGVHTDWREPNVIRAAPVPFYNSFEDIERFVKALQRALNN